MIPDRQNTCTKSKGTKTLKQSVNHLQNQQIKLPKHCLGSCISKPEHILPTLHLYVSITNFEQVFLHQVGSITKVVYCGQVLLWSSSTKVLQRRQVHCAELQHLTVLKCSANPQFLISYRI